MGIHQEPACWRLKTRSPGVSTGAQATSFLSLLPRVQSVDCWNHPPPSPHPHPHPHLPSTWVSREMETRWLKTQRSAAHSGLPMFVAHVAGFSLTRMRLQSTTCVLSRGRKHITSLTSNPFPTPFCGRHGKPTSLGDLEHSLAQGGDNFYLTERESLFIRKEQTAKPWGSTGQIRET